MDKQDIITVALAVSATVAALALAYVIASLLTGHFWYG